MKGMPPSLALLFLAATLAHGAMDPRKPAPTPPAIRAVLAAADRLPGDTMDDAIPIPGLPFAVTGSTVGYAMDYGDQCPYGCLGPDVVYSFTASADAFLDVSLCNEGTDYDTNLYVYLNDHSPMIACDEDGCYFGPEYPGPYLSRIRFLRAQARTTYYIVVSGYCGQAGQYELTVDPIDDPFFVLPDGSGTFPNMHDALQHCVNGDTIELADGVFTGAGNRNLDYNGRAVVVRSRSGNPNACIIDPQGLGRGVVFDNNEGPASVLESVTIRNGSAGTSYNGGGAIVCYSAYPTVRNCVFSDNQAQNGGACSFWWSTSRAVFEDCLFLANQATSEGGAVYAFNYEIDDPMPRFLRCTFTGNAAQENGGAIAIQDGSPEIINCTIVKNAAGDPAGIGGGIYSPGSQAIVLQNTILAFNRAASAGGAFLGGGTVTCCNAYHNWGGDWGGAVDPSPADGNISLDPLFCDYENQDFTLAGDSPCRPFSPPNPECDLIGAWPVSCAPAALEEGFDLAGESLTVYPSPFVESCRILPGPIPPGRAALVTVHDLTGRIVRRLPVEAGSWAQPGVTWDGRNEEGQNVASGVYLIRVSTAGTSRSQRVILAR